MATGFQTWEYPGREWQGWARDFKQRDCIRYWLSFPFLGGGSYSSSCLSALDPTHGSDFSTHNVTGNNNSNNEFSSSVCPESVYFGGCHNFLWYSYYFSVMQSSRTLCFDLAKLSFSVTQSL